jgi:hypothetical protein
MMACWGLENVFDTVPCLRHATKASNECLTVGRRMSGDNRRTYVALPVWLYSS